ncbi:hypothetical protein ACFP7A_11365 [Sporolactobacillus kofuensis]|uniref:Uncharacterized protein n=1 Tax=Sporolactobacillus kofuensis TaxID=269672 RepID=A0ABW1WG80_9BACL|nr:hypothetical protein [Sporolactobacillus kofuensis]MCO7176440.1 hypothetical protein [Sporolactobacillus kofuensis]
MIRKFRDFQINILTDHKLQDKIRKISKQAIGQVDEAMRIDAYVEVLGRTFF